MAKVLSTDSPSSLLDKIEEIAVDNPDNPTDAEIEKHQHRLKAGERYVVTRRRIAETTLLTAAGELGRLELQEFGSASIKAKSWDDIRYKDIPYVCYNNRGPKPIDSPRTGPPETTYSHPGCSDGVKSFKYCNLNDLKVHGGAPFGTVPSQAGKGRLYFYKIGFNKVKPVASLDAVTDDANGAYPDFKPLSGGDGVVLVGKYSGELIVGIDGTNLTSFKPVLIRANENTTRIKAVDSSSIDSLRSKPSVSDLLAHLHFGDLVVNVKKLDKKSNFEVSCTKTGGNGIRG
jgi:hypothetical protein